MKSLQDIDWLLDEGHRFVFWFRPRCGSTTLTRWFFENRGVKFGGFSIAAFRDKWLECHLSSLESVLASCYQELHKFVVVRDPFERCVSSFLHVVNNAHDGQWDIVRPFVDASLAKHDLTFEEWVGYLERIDLDCCHTIWRRQSSLSCWERGVDDVVALDNLNEYLLLMNKRFCLNAQPTRNSVTVPMNEKTTIRTGLLRKAKYFGSQPFRELLRYKGKHHFTNFPHYEQFYDDQLHCRVASLYSADIKLFSGTKHITPNHVFGAS